MVLNRNMQMTAITQRECHAIQEFFSAHHQAQIQSLMADPASLFALGSGAPVPPVRDAKGKYPPLHGWPGTSKKEMDAGNTHEIPHSWRRMLPIYNRCRPIMMRYVVVDGKLRLQPMGVMGSKVVQFFEAQDETYKYTFDDERKEVLRKALYLAFGKPVDLKFFPPEQTEEAPKQVERVKKAKVQRFKCEICGWSNAGSKYIVNFCLLRCGQQNVIDLIDGNGPPLQQPVTVRSCELVPQQQWQQQQQQQQQQPQRPVPVAEAVTETVPGGTTDGVQQQQQQPQHTTPPKASTTTTTTQTNPTVNGAATANTTTFTITNSTGATPTNATTTTTTTTTPTTNDATTTPMPSSTNTNTTTTPTTDGATATNIPSSDATMATNQHRQQRQQQQHHHHHEAVPETVPETVPDGATDHALRDGSRSPSQCPRRRKRKSVNLDTSTPPTVSREVRDLGGEKNFVDGNPLSRSNRAKRRRKRPKKKKRKKSPRAFPRAGWRAGRRAGRGVRVSLANL